MEFSEMAHFLTLYLAPFLPYLLKASEKAAEEAGKKIGEESWNKAKAIWGKLRPKVEIKPSALEAIEDVGKSPGDEDALASLRQQLKKLLAGDSSLMAEMSDLVKTIEPSNNVIVSGSRAVGIGRDAIGSTIITGDANAIGNNNSINVTKTSAETHGITLAEFIELLSQLRSEMLNTTLDDRLRQAIDTDVKTIEAEVEDDAPSLPLIESKLKSIESIATSAAGLGSASMALIPIIQKAIEYAQVVFK
jgi:hypothetical protein